jgi:alpha-tubulin suppressor-like RCC1 family protein
MELFIHLEVIIYLILGNHKGQLGLNHYQDTFKPTAIYTQPFLAKKIIDISAALEHSVILTFDGKIFTFGSSELGQIGDGQHGWPNNVKNLFILVEKNSYIYMAWNST